MIREAIRVSRKQVVVVESVFEKTWDLKLLTFLDIWMNRIRSGWRMRGQEEDLSFKKASEWQTLFEKNGWVVIKQARKGRWVHKRHFFLLHPAAAG